MELLTNFNREFNTELTLDRVSEKLSDQYAPVSTKLLLQPFFNKGWVNVNKKRNKKGSREWLTLEHPEFKFTNGDTIRLEVVNSYDGSSSLKIMAGIGRLVCLNGMVVGKDFEQFKFVHRGNKIYENIEKSYEQIVAKLAGLKEKVDRLNNIILPPQATHNIINNIAKRVFESNGEKKIVSVVGVDFTVRNSLLERHRQEDLNGDAWTTLNVIQENIIRNGRLTARIGETNRETNETVFKDTNKKSNEGKMSSLELNKIITEEFFKAVA